MLVRSCDPAVAHNLDIVRIASIGQKHICAMSAPDRGISTLGHWRFQWGPMGFPNAGLLGSRSAMAGATKSHSTGVC